MAPDQANGPPFTRLDQAELLTEKDVLRLLLQCSTTTVGLRDRALLAGLWWGGLRLAEALALLPEDVDVRQATLLGQKYWSATVVVRGRRARRVELEPPVAAMVARWLHYRADLRLPPGTRLFCTVTRGVPGRPLAPAHARRLLLRLARKAGIRKRTNTEAFRRAHAAELARSGRPVAWLQRHLGYGSRASAIRYLRRLVTTAKRDDAGAAAAMVTQPVKLSL